MNYTIQLRANEPLPYVVVDSTLNRTVSRHRTREAARHAATVCNRLDLYARLWDTYHLAPRSHN